MQDQKPFHLFNSSGIWIGFCLGNNVFDVDAVWRGWFPWSDSAEVVAPRGTYSGLLLGIGYTRLAIAPKNLPMGASVVELKYSSIISGAEGMRPNWPC